MPRRILRWIGKALLWAVGAFLVLAVTGALYQLIATEVDERRYPPPGELVPPLRSLADTPSDK